MLELEPMSPGGVVRVSVVTPGMFLAVCGTVVGVVLLWGSPAMGPASDESAAGRPSPYRMGEPGVREGALDLHPGSVVYDLSHPEWGLGTVAEVGERVGVSFRSGEWIL